MVERRSRVVPWSFCLRFCDNIRSKVQPCSCLESRIVLFVSPAYYITQPASLTNRRRYDKITRSFQNLDWTEIPVIFGLYFSPIKQKNVLEENYEGY